jgi:hypothetical protein
MLGLQPDIDFSVAFQCNSFLQYQIYQNKLDSAVNEA